MAYPPETPFSEIRAFVEATLHRHLPDYATWSPLTQERWRATQSPAQEAIKEAVLIACLSDNTGAPPDALRAALAARGHDLDAVIGAEGQHLANTIRLVLTGIGDDYFYLNESMGEGEQLLDFRTIGAWDRHSHHYQNEAEQRHNPAYVPRPYYGRAYAEWGRAVVGDRFSYITLSTLAGHVLSHLENAAHAFIDTEVPHTWEPNPDHGTRSHGGILWSKEVNANGREALYHALTKASHLYQQERYVELAKAYALQPRGHTWLLPKTDDFSHPWEPYYDALFSDPTAMDAVRWTAFTADMAAYAGDPAEVEALLAAEEARQRAALEAIIANHPA